MRQVNKGNRPATQPRGTNIVDIENGEKLVRVVVTESQTPDGRIVLKTQAFRIDETGAIVMGPTGAPITAPARLHIIPPEKANRIKPGWIKVNLAPGDIPYRADRRNLVVDSVPRDPPAPEDRDMWALVGVDYYRWDDGEAVIAAMKDAMLMGG